MGLFDSTLVSPTHLLLFLSLFATGILALAVLLIYHHFKRWTRVINFRLNLSFSFGSELFEAEEEKGIIAAFMRVGMAAQKADGCAFVPFDEVLPAFTPQYYGNLPSDSVDWSARVGSQATRKECKACFEKHGGEDCVLLREASREFNMVACIPVKRSGREIGQVSFFFRTGQEVENDVQGFLSELVRVTDRALETALSRKREKEALAFLRNQSFQTGSLETLLNGLAGEIRNDLDLKVALFWIAPEIGYGESLLVHNSDPRSDVDMKWLMESDRLEHRWRSMLNQGKKLSPIQLDHELENYLAFPIARSEGSLLGFFVLGDISSLVLTGEQVRLLQVVTGLVAQLIQKEHQHSQLQYRAVLSERLHLSREIHDGLAQTLAFLKMEAARMQDTMLSGEMDALSESLSACHRTLSDAYLEARQVIDNLRHTPGEDLIEWIKRTADDYRLSTGVMVNLERLKISDTFQPGVKAQLMRIIQEALANVRKHANAHQVSLSGTDSIDGVIIEIQDNGCGFTPDDIKPASQYGLQTMKERADAIGAEFQIISKPGKGTTVRLTVPQRESVNP